MKTKKRWIALLLSLQIGLGHFYIGKYKKAFLFALSPFIIYFVMFYLLQNIPFAPIIGLLLIISLWIYTIIDIWRSFPIREDEESSKYSTWYFVLLFLIFTIFLSFIWNTVAPIKTFIMPSRAMENTLFLGDMFIANKQSDVNRNDVVVFRYPLNPQTTYIERVVAKSGDEVIYIDGELLIHFSEGDEYITKNYNQKFIKKYRDKLWVKNPYMINNKNINYSKDKNRESLFQILFQSYMYGSSKAMQPIYIEDKNLDTYQLMGKKVNALYIKIKDGNYFMVGDNRENSNDSRFWGEVNQQYIFGVGKVVYFNYTNPSRIGIEIK
jgi:signal peptidase I